MDIHKPHAAKTWSEFLIELGTVVVGILIALGLEQAVETVHWSHQVHEAEDAIRQELLQDDRASYYRLASDDCARRKLDEIETLLKASRDDGAAVPPISPYVRPLRIWLTDAWENARAQQVAGHIPVSRMTAYANVYFYPGVLQQQTQTEIQSTAALNSLTTNAGRLQPAERDRLFLALSQARFFNNLLDLGSWQLLKRSERLGLSLTAADKGELVSAARAQFGACAIAPDLTRSPYNPEASTVFLKSN